MRRRTLDATWIAGIVTAWLVFGAAQALLQVGLGNTRPDELPASLALHESSAVFWVLVTLLVQRWRHFVQYRTRSRTLRLSAHAAFLIVTAIAGTAVQRAALVVLGERLGVSFAATLLYYADVTLACYVAAVMIARARDAHTLFVRREEQTIALGEQLDRAQLDTLELQLQPHFLFNTLGMIAELAHEAPARAATMLRDLGRLLRASIAERGGELVTLGEELELLEPYLSIQRARFADWLAIEQEIDPGARDALVPRFVLQPLIENAVRHGLTNRSKRGLIVIRATSKNNTLRLMVEDNGVGLHSGRARAGNGAGLRNVRERLTTLHGDLARLDLNESTAGGVVVTVELPHERNTLRAEGPSTRPALRAADTGERGDEEERLPTTTLRPLPSRSRVALVTAGGWFLVGAFWAQQSVAYTIFRGRLGQVDLRAAVRRDFTTALIWAACTPVILWLARRLPIAEGKATRAIAAHSVASVVCAFAVTSIARLLSPSDGYPVIASVYASYYIGGVVLYWIVVCLGHTRRLTSWIHERELAAVRLRSALQAARRRRLTSSLRPAVLLDTLEQLALLVATEPQRADWLIARLGSLLRATLDCASRPVTQLGREIAALRAYADVLSTAVVPGLHIEANVEIPLETPVYAGVLRSVLDELTVRWALDRQTLTLSIGAGPDGPMVRATTTGSQRATVHAPAASGLDTLVSSGVVVRANIGRDDAVFALARVDAQAESLALEPGGVVRRIKWSAPHASAMEAT